MRPMDPFDAPLRIGLLVLVAALLACGPIRATPSVSDASTPGDPAASAGATPVDPIVARIEEGRAYSIGLLAYFYGYPALDYMRLMREQTADGPDRSGPRVPINALFFQDAFTEPGSAFSGRAPNHDTLYFRAWLDLGPGPVEIETPDTQDRYYALTFADFYSEVQHTGRRTTGTAPQRIWVVGPEWQAEPPERVHVVRLKTHRGYLLGRLLVDGPDDLESARQLLHRFRMRPTAPVPPPPDDLPRAEDLESIAAFRHLNEFLRTNPRLPGEEALMAQFDGAGFGPNVRFEAARLSPDARRGLERAAVDGRAALLEAPRRGAPRHTGWSAVSAREGQFGFDYHARAVIEANGFLINLPEESVYTSTLTDANGAPLTGDRRFRLVFEPGQLPPHDAFWSVTAYDIQTMDLIPNAIGRHSLNDRGSDLVWRSDGALEIRFQRERPERNDVNWLPVGPGRFFLTFRIYQPRPEVIAGHHRLPAVEPLP